MSIKKKQSLTMNVPVETARILYDILEYVPLVEQAINDEKAKKGITFRKLTKSERQLLVDLYDDLAFRLTMGFFE